MPRASLLPESPFSWQSSSFLYWSAWDDESCFCANVPNGLGRRIWSFPFVVLRDAESERIFYWCGYCKFSMKLSMMRGQWCSDRTRFHSCVDRKVFCK